MKSKEELKQVLEALVMEKAEEVHQFEVLLNETPIKERIDKGVCWYPLNFDSWGWSLGEHPYVIIERTKQLGKSHRFRPGQVVSLFSEKFIEDNLEERGVIQYIKRDRMKVIFYGTEMPRWVMSGKIGVQLNFDERSYQEMELALVTVMEAKNNRIAELREILLGHVEAQFEDAHAFELPRLNPSQNEAVHQILTARDVAVVHGPPGTGKTTTLVAAIQQLVKRESPILVCAPSNSATDLLTEKLAEGGLNVVRIGNVSRVDENLLMHTVEGRLNESPDMQEVKKMKKEAQKVRKQAEKFKRSFGPKEREERRELRREAKMLVHQARMLEDYIIDRIIKDADVITATLVGSTSSYIKDHHFNTVVIDEAAQALEPSTWIPIMKAERVVFAGDPFQLPPTVKSNEAAKHGFAVTLLEKAVERLGRIQLLDTQYRMNEVIMDFSNHQFYEGRLKASEYVKDWVLAVKEGGDNRPVEFIDTAGCSYEEKRNPESRSYYNPEEYYVLRKHLDHLLTLSADPTISIGIISPYREQVIFIRDLIKEDFDHYPDADIVVDTIDAFQGQERDVIYISMVRCNDEGAIGFLKDTRRMNVAMTRARKKLVVIGDSATLASFGFYGDFLDYCDLCDAYVSAWEWS